MTLSKLRTTFMNTAGVRINSRFSGYDSRIIQDSARIISTTPSSTRRTTTRVAISGPAPAAPIQLIPTPISQILPTGIPSAPRPTAPIEGDATGAIIITRPREEAVMVYVPPLITLAPLATEDEEEFFPAVEPEEVNFIQNPNDESFSGPSLTDAEKPKIIAISSIDIVNGRPSKNVIFFKSLTSSDKKATKYTLKKKNLLESSSYVNVAVLAPNQLIPAIQFTEIVNSESSETKNIFGIIDSTFSANNVYVYKIYVEWVEKTVEEKQVFINIPSEETLIATTSLFRAI